MNGAVATIAIAAALFCACSGQGMFGNNWMQGLFANINQMQQQLQGNMQMMKEQIQENIRKNMQQVEQVSQKMAQQIGSIGEHTMTIGTRGQSVSVNRVGDSRTVVSGQSSNGEPYFRDSEDKIVGDTLLHTDRIYNPSRKSIDEFKYTLDLKNPKAKPVPITSS